MSATDTFASRHLDILNRHLAAENEHRLDETLATLHEECVFEDIPLQQTYRGREGAGQYYQTWWQAFDLIVQGEQRHWTTTNQMIAEARYVGRHVGDFFGIAATGNPIDIRLAVVIGFRDGLMSGERFYYDLASLLSQIGALRLPTLKRRAVLGSGS